MSRRLAQFWYQSNSVQFLLHNNITRRIVSPRKFVCRSDCSFQNTCDDLNIKFYKSYLRTVRVLFKKNQTGEKRRKKVG